jgi:uncharacterized iron-regulated membrane protein
VNAIRRRFWAARVHRTLALVVGIQILLWTASGLVMTLFPIEEVRGEHLVRPAEPVVLDRPLVMPDFAGVPVEAIALRRIGDRPVLIVDHPGGRQLHDPYTGAEVARPDAAGIRALAARAYRGSGRITRLRLITARPPVEYRGELPVWQVSFDDAARLNLYLDATTGDIVARRTRLWRVYDFLWMLHIMDYRAREDFHHPLISIAAGLALSTVVAGGVLAVVRTRTGVRRRRIAD